MTPANLLQLIILAAIWGASFLFMRIAVPALGPVWLIEWRVLLGALLLALAGRWFRHSLAWRTHWRHYLVLGLFNSALPFVLFAWAAQTLTASLLSVVNATAPIWGAVIAWAWSREPLRGRVAAGLALGVAGVALLMGLDPAMLKPGSGWVLAGVLLAPCCYAIASHYAKSTRNALLPYANAHGSMWAATLLLWPVLPFAGHAPLPETATPVLVWGAVLGLGLLCTGLAYLMYFRLVAALGAASALTVTFLIPVFGILWGHLFLGEAVGWQTLFGALVVLTGTALVTGFDPRTLWARKAVPHG
ncbi:MAG: DMT family transporter [Hylemonella sp.]|nr:DMT family transporter [Hylemonella sp.]